MTAADSETFVLGIETSCDETAAAVVARSTDGHGRILSNVVRSQWAQHRPFGGVVPELAARAHVECLDEIVRDALRTAATGLHELDAVAVAAGPGLIGGLMVGVVSAEAIGAGLSVPVIGVNHLEAHALTAGLTDGVRPPYLLLLVSGGHTQLLLVEDIGRYVRLGTTIDDALGEAFDKTAKLLGLGMPGGPAVEAAARRGCAGRHELPRPMLGRPVPNFSFAGLKTAVRLAAEAAAPMSEADVCNLCADFEDAVTHAVCDRVSCAMTLATPKLQAASERRLVVAGGVAANLRLRSALADLCSSRGYTLVAPPLALCTDNGAMIAWTGAERLAHGLAGDGPVTARARWPLDAEAVPVVGSGRLGAKA
jgi:N6-L-threonylcarbamoyladenine synthase